MVVTFKLSSSKQTHNSIKQGHWGGGGGGGGEGKTINTTPISVQILVIDYDHVKTLRKQEKKHLKNKNILYTRKLVADRIERRWWYKKHGNKI